MLSAAVLVASLTVIASGCGGGHDAAGSSSSGLRQSVLRAQHTSAVLTRRLDRLAVAEGGAMAAFQTISCYPNPQVTVMSCTGVGGGLPKTTLSTPIR
jgi:hypothetical protein